MTRRAKRTGAVGVPLALLALALPARAQDDADPVKQARVLLIALDAVPYDTVARLADPSLGEQALFAQIGAPVPMVSSFPSNTTVAFAGMLEDLGASPPPGYEARFFDRQRGRVRGGGPRSYHEIEFSWREFFDWKIDGALRKAWGYARPLKFARTEVDALVEAFERSQDQVLFAYVSSTDAIGHLKSPAALEDMLLRLDAALAELRARDPRPFYVVVFSDHGMDGDGTALRNVRKAIKRAAKVAGFKVRRKLRQPDDLVFVPFGLLTSVVAFTEAGREVDAALAVATAPGISLCAAPLGPDRFVVVGAGGEAELERRSPSGNGELEWRYGAEHGDPLAYAAVRKRLEDERASGNGGDHGDGWFSDQAWFGATLDHRFPDALHRLARAFDLVENQASLVCSVDTGYMYGPAYAEMTGNVTIGRLRYTHGALDRGATLGFLVTDHPAWDGIESLRFDRAFEPFVELFRAARGRPLAQLPGQGCRGVRGRSMDQQARPAE